MVTAVMARPEDVSSVMYQIIAKEATDDPKMEHC
jgi:hypothetical protein